MKIQYKNKTYEQTNWSCCDCELSEWKQELTYYLDCTPFVKIICCEHAFKLKQLFNDSIFNLQ